MGVLTDAGKAELLRQVQATGGATGTTVAGLFQSQIAALDDPTEQRSPTLPPPDLGEVMSVNDTQDLVIWRFLEADKLASNASGGAGEVIVSDGAGGTSWGTVGSAGIDQTADYTWTGTHTFNTNGIESGTGILLSHVADGSGVNAWTVNNDQSLQEDTTRQLLAVQRNGVDKARINANGSLWLNDGLAVGIAESSTIASDLLFAYVFHRFDDATAGGHQALTLDARATPPVGMTGTPTYYGVRGLAVAEESAFAGNVSSVVGLQGEVQYQPRTWSQCFVAYGLEGRAILADTGAAKSSCTELFGINAYWQMTGQNYNLPATGAIRVQSPFDSGSGNTVPIYAGILIENQTAAVATARHAILVEAQGANALYGNIALGGGDWDDGHHMIGSGHLWNDSGTLRWKSSAPASASDGTDLAAGGGGGGDSYLEWAGL